MADLVDVNTNDTYRIKYSINFLILNTMIVTKEFLKSIYVPDIGPVPITSEHYINEPKNITK